MSEKKMHWTEDPDVWPGFWAFVKGDLFLTEDEAHRELDCESVKGYKGTKEQAFKILKAASARKLYEAAQALPEAPMIAWTKFVSANGYEWSFTFRAGLPPQLQALALDQVHDAVINFEAMAADAGWLAAGALNGAPARVMVGADHPILVKPAEGSPPAAPQSQPQSGSGGGSETFHAESVTAQVSPNGNRYYSIKGGRCKKHGVTAWPEVAEPQLEKLTKYNPAQLEIGQPWEIGGFSIQAIAEIPAGKEYPNKVTAFAPMQ